MPREENNDTHQTIRTPNPSERSLLVTVKEEVFAHNPDILPVVGTRYGDFDRDIFGQDYRRQFENYIYADQLDNSRADATLLFVKTRTDVERNTPYRDYTENRPDVPWPNVLKWVEFGEDFGFPVSQETIDGAGNRALVISGRPVILYSWLPGMSLTTKVRVRKFQSEIPFPDHETISNEPRPTEVSFDYIGKDGGFPRCLHPDILVPGQNSGYRVLGSAGKPESGNRTANNSQFFPETNHKEWQTYIVNTVSFENGLFTRTEETFYVPRRPKLSERQS